MFASRDHDVDAPRSTIASQLPSALARHSSLTVWSKYAR